MSKARGLLFNFNEAKKFTFRVTRQEVVSREREGILSVELKRKDKAVKKEIKEREDTLKSNLEDEMKRKGDDFDKEYIDKLKNSLKEVKSDLDSELDQLESSFKFKDSVDISRDGSLSYDNKEVFKFFDLYINRQVNPRHIDEAVDKWSDTKSEVGFEEDPKDYKISN